MTEREVQVQSGDPDAAVSNTDPAIDFQTSPEAYRHWKLTFDGAVATLALDVDDRLTGATHVL